MTLRPDPLEEIRRRDYLALVQAKEQELVKGWWATMEHAIWRNDPPTNTRRHLHEKGCNLSGDYADPYYPCECGTKDEAEKARRRSLAGSDPRRRWCEPHDVGYEDHGGGPSPYSVCPTCYEGQVKKARERDGR